GRIVTGEVVVVDLRPGGLSRRSVVVDADGAERRHGAGRDVARREGRRRRAVHGEAVILHQGVGGPVANLDPGPAGVGARVPGDHLAARTPEVLPAALGVVHERVAGDRGGGVVLVPEAADAGVVHEVVADRVAVVRVGTATGEPDPERELILRH